MRTSSFQSALQSASPPGVARFSFPARRFSVSRHRILLAASGLIAVWVEQHSPGQLVVDQPGVEIVERGQDYAVIETTDVVTNEDGQVTLSTGRFTLIENGLHYLEDGVWKPSEDLLEPVDGGVMARRGPIRALIGLNLAAERVSALEGPDGTRLEGAVRALLVSDSASGQSVIVAAPRAGAVPEQVGPNQLLFQDAFDGTVADLLYIWRHNAFSQDLVLRERPPLPEGWDPAGVRIELVTECFADREPEIQEGIIQPAGQAAFTDHGVIRFGAMAMVMGRAFVASPGQGVRLGEPDPAVEGVPVRKEWTRTADGRAFLVESIGWADAAAAFEGMPAVRMPPERSPMPRATALARLPKPAGRPPHSPPLRLAQGPYEPAGLLIDFVIYPDTPVTHFLSGETYYIRSNYYSGAAVQFDPGCVIKYKNSQSECSFVVVDSSRIVAAFFDTHLSEYGLGQEGFRPSESVRSTGWAVSTDGGQTFGDQGAIPPEPPDDPWEGDAGDPVMARDTADGIIYLLVNASRDQWSGLRLWRSNDEGESFELVNSDVFGGAVTGGDKPMIAVNNFPDLANSHTVYVAGSQIIGTLQIWATYSTDRGETWATAQALGPGHGADIAICPDGTVYVFYVLSTAVGSGQFQNSIQYCWLLPEATEWSAPGTVPAHPDSDFLYSVRPNGSGDLKRHKTAHEADYFVSNAFPRVVVNSQQERLYVVYADLPMPYPYPYPLDAIDRGDIFIQEAALPAKPGSLDWQWAGAKRVNNDATETDQWNPAVAFLPEGPTLFIGYYSRQSRPDDNDLIMAYGAKADVSHGVPDATFDMIPISPEAFEPLFPGTVAWTPPQDPWRYDHVWTQGDVCLDINSRYVGAAPGAPTCDQPGSYLETAFIYQHFNADDYTWAGAHAPHFFYAWCDRSDSYVTPQGSRPDPNIRLARIAP